jgi:hypothetical protein
VFVPTLRKEGLVTDRKPTIMRGSDGTIIEVSDGNRRTRSMQRTRIRTSFVMWDKFFAICDCVPLNMLPESAEMFAGFEPIGD